MGLSPEHVALIESCLGPDDADDQAVARLRKGLSGLTVTRCDTSDADAETPFRQFARYTVFLVDASDHCWTFTIDPAQATGVVVGTNRGPV